MIIEFSLRDSRKAIDYMSNLEMFNGLWEQIATNQIRIISDNFEIREDILAELDYNDFEFTTI